MQIKTGKKSKFYFNIRWKWKILKSSPRGEFLHHSILLINLSKLSLIFPRNWSTHQPWNFIDILQIHEKNKSSFGQRSIGVIKFYDSSFSFFASRGSLSYLTYIIALLHINIYTIPRLSLFFEFFFLMISSTQAKKKDHKNVNQFIS